MAKMAKNCQKTCDYFFGPPKPPFCIKDKKNLYILNVGHIWAYIHANSQDFWKSFNGSNKTKCVKKNVVKKFQQKSFNKSYVLGTWRYFWVPEGTFGYLMVLLGTWRYFWVLDFWYFFWVPAGTFVGYLQVLWVPEGTFGYLHGTFGYLRVPDLRYFWVPEVLLGTWWYFWVPDGTFGYLMVLLGTWRYFYVP